MTDEHNYVKIQELGPLPGGLFTRWEVCPPDPGQDPEPPRVFATASDAARHVRETYGPVGISWDAFSRLGRLKASALRHRDLGPELRALEVAEGYVDEALGREQPPPDLAIQACDLMLRTWDRIERLGKIARAR